MDKKNEIKRIYAEAEMRADTDRCREEWQKFCKKKGRLPSIYDIWEFMDKLAELVPDTEVIGGTFEPEFFIERVRKEFGIEAKEGMRLQDLF